MEKHEITVMDHRTFHPTREQVYGGMREFNYYTVVLRSDTKVITVHVKEHEQPTLYTWIRQRAGRLIAEPRTLSETVEGTIKEFKVFEPADMNEWKDKYARRNLSSMGFINDKTDCHGED